MAGSFMACVIFFFSSRIRHTRYWRDWSSDVCSSDLTREYRYGDDLRMVHWRATARTGELMVRLEERPWRAAASMFLDTRVDAHLLGGRTGGPGGDPAAPPDTLEWVVEAAASIGVHLLRRGAGLRVVTDSGELTPSLGRGTLGPEELLEQLAEMGGSQIGRASWRE